MTAGQVTDETIRAAQAGDEDAMWRIVDAYEPQLRTIVRQAAPGAGREDTEDLLQEARAVLVNRVRTYDTTSSAAQLQTYAHMAIRGSVAEEWVRMSTGLTVDASSALRVKRALFEAGGNREVAALRLNARYNMAHTTFVALVDALADMEWLDAPLTGAASYDGTSTLADTISDPSAEVSDPTERRELARWLLANIAERRAYALRAFYGVSMTQQPDADVAAHLRVATGSVRELRRRGISSAQTVAARHGLVA